jgi:hypothetical protein
MGTTTSGSSTNGYVINISHLIEGNERVERLERLDESNSENTA